MLSRDKDFKSGLYIEAYGINSCNFDEKLKPILKLKFIKKVKISIIFHQKNSSLKFHWIIKKWN